MESPLIRGSLRETLRLFPVAPFVGRFLDSNAKMGDFELPKGTLALASFYTSARDPVNFEEPHRFNPDRWIRSDNDKDKVLNSNASLPFAIGSRSCVGRKIATYQIHSLITKVQKETLS